MSVQDSTAQDWSIICFSRTRPRCPAVWHHHRWPHLRRPSQRREEAESEEHLHQLHPHTFTGTQNTHTWVLLMHPPPQQRCPKSVYVTAWLSFKGLSRDGHLGRAATSRLTESPPTAESNALTTEPLTALAGRLDDGSAPVTYGLMLHFDSLD